MFGTRAYVLFTVDRLITAATRQLQNLVGDETSTGAIQLFNRYRASSSSNLPSAAALDRREYADAAEKLLVNQNCFKVGWFHAKAIKLFFGKILYFLPL
jgi:histone deacetylase complex regulatory component SIN3